MKTRSMTLWVAAVCVACFAIAARAQTTNLVSTYRLGAGSKFQTGCFPPCLCPSLPPTGAPKGTFRLLFTGQDPQFRNYSVLDVNWFVDIAGTMTRITGSGTYKVTLGPVPPAHQMQLDLTVGENKAQHFDSGLVPANAVGTTSIQIRVTINGGQCQDTIIDIGAGPVPATQMFTYNLVQPSHYGAGCFPPCCVGQVQQAVTGGFLLIPLPHYANVSPRGSQDFAIINANWAVAGPTPAAQTFQGYGVYRRKLGPAVTPTNTSTHRLVMDLRTGSAAAATEFDSGWKPVGPSPTPSTNAALPNIDATISAQDFACQDQRFEVHARRPTP